jgi:pyridoxamine 5'-phosphate oxidase
MWTELPENKHNDAPKNERVFETDMPTFTTDVRMQKVPQLLATGDEKQAGGGPVEAVWWVQDTKTQWRMKGQAFVIGGTEGQDRVKEILRRRMRVVGEEKPWSWEKEVTAHFGNMNPGMRGM